ncbi:hypothetical protein Baya_2694 [Bagarius yarrelli]|uniref:Uncharacterized protein n=1 Tax=Bagarius yarrelli TaxID=175774 RepID=A0A556VYA2_BAGYA|nr:hypothetical protein Baya_2694 [Bagarius yarrelli]
MVTAEELYETIASMGIVLLDWAFSLIPYAESDSFVLTWPSALQPHFLLPTKMLIVLLLKGELTFDVKHNTSELSEPPDPSPSYQEVGNNGNRVTETHRQTDGSRWRG